MIRELWTATKKDDQMIYFEVEDIESGTTRKEQKFITALPLMFLLGGYPEQMGIIMKVMPLPWSFKKIGPHIYLKENPE